MLRPSDHDLGCDEKDTACGIVDEESAQLDLILGSSDQTSDLMVDALEAKWKGLEEQEQSEVSRLQLQMDTGPQSSGRRTQFLSRMVPFAEAIGKPIQLWYDPPSHSQSHPIERGGGLWERHWKGTKRIDAQTRLEWAKSMTWKGLHPVVELSRQVYQKGIKLSQKAMQAVEARLECDPKLPKYDILIQPASTA